MLDQGFFRVLDNKSHDISLCYFYVSAFVSNTGMFLICRLSLCELEEPKDRYYNGTFGPVS